MLCNKSARLHSTVMAELPCLCRPVHLALSLECLSLLLLGSSGDCICNQIAAYGSTLSFMSTLAHRVWEQHSGQGHICCAQLLRVYDNCA